MSRYLGPRVPGASVSFTLPLAGRRLRLLGEQVEALREAVRVTMAERSFRIEAWVVLPEHFCRRGMRIFHRGGGRSSRGSRAGCPWACSAQAMKHGRNEGFGNVGSGSDISATRPISRRTCGIAGGTR